MFCTSCGTQVAAGSGFCSSCGKPLAGSAPRSGVTLDKPGAVAMQRPAPVDYDEVPQGVKGWSWGAFLLSWIWAIGNRTWIGLLALVPYIGLFVAIWLGLKGREMAWKNGDWDSVEHFNRVQKSWSRWAVGIVLGIFLLGVVSAIAIPAYYSYTQRAHAVESSM